MNFQSSTPVGIDRYEKELRNSFNNKKRKSPSRVAVLVLITALTFLSKYTMSIGILIITITLVLFLLIKIVKSEKVIQMMVKSERDHTYLGNGEILYGFNEELLFAKNNSLNIEASWDLVKSYYESDGYYRLRLKGLIPFYFKRSEMEDSNCYNSFQEKIRNINNSI